MSAWNLDEVKELFTSLEFRSLLERLMQDLPEAAEGEGTPFELEVRVVDTAAGLEDLAARVDARTRVVAVSWVAFHNGWVFPIEEIAAFYTDAFLRDVAASHRGGLTLTASVQIAAKGEYGELTPEIRKMADQLSWNVPFNEAQHISPERLYSHMQKLFRENKDADGIYMLGTGWRCLDIIHLLEEDLRVPVVHAVPARVWAVEKRLHVRQPVKGYGRLLADMP